MKVKKILFLAILLFIQALPSNATLTESSNIELGNLYPSLFTINEVTNEVYIFDYYNNELIVIDAINESIKNKISLNESIKDISIDESTGLVYAISSYGNKLFRINTSSLDVASITFNNYSSHLFNYLGLSLAIIPNNKIFIAGYPIQVVNISEDAFEQVSPIEEGADGIFINPSTEKLYAWAINIFNSKIYFKIISNGLLEKEFKKYYLGKIRLAIDKKNNLVYVLGLKKKTIVFDANSNKIINKLNYEIDEYLRSVSVVNENLLAIKHLHEVTFYNTVSGNGRKFSKPCDGFTYSSRSSTFFCLTPSYDDKVVVSEYDSTDGHFKDRLVLNISSYEDYSRKISALISNDDLNKLYGLYYSNDSYQLKILNFSQ